MLDWMYTVYWIVKKLGLPITRNEFLFLFWAGNKQVLQWWYTHLHNRYPSSARYYRWLFMTAQTLREPEGGVGGGGLLDWFTKSLVTPLSDETVQDLGTQKKTKKKRASKFWSLIRESRRLSVIREINGEKPTWYVSYFFPVKDFGLFLCDARKDLFQWPWSRSIRITFNCDVITPLIVTGCIFMAVDSFAKCQLKNCFSG